ncbi:MAG: hypothetical protein U9P14_09800, partial [Gemmatimonadota bacterium]|nr:hypothetical protein [Gemmatimonadota bacterium]
MQLIMIPGTLLLGLGWNIYGWALAMLIIGICGGFTYSCSIYYSTSRPPETSPRTGVHEAFIGLGALTGPLAGGCVAGFWNIQSPYLLCMALFLVTLAAQICILYRKLP